MMTECVRSQMAMGGCPFDKCMQKGVDMKMKDLKRHLVEECNKIQL